MSQKELNQRVFKVVDTKKEEIVETLRDLVRIPTVVGKEGEGQEYIQRLYSDLELSVSTFEADYEKVHRHKAFIESVFAASISKSIPRSLAINIT